MATVGCWHNKTIRATCRLQSAFHSKRQSFIFHTEGNFTNYYSIKTVGEAAEETASPGYLEFYHFPISENDYVSGHFLIEKGDKYNLPGEKLAEAKN